MTRQSLPLVSSLTTENLTHFKSADDYVLVAHVPAGDATGREAFEKAAEDLHRRFLCGMIETNDIDAAKIVLYKNTDSAEEEAGEEKEATFISPFDSEAIKTFAVRAIIPAIGEVNSDTLSLYRESNLPVGWIFTSTAPDRSRLVELLSPVARTHKNEIHFGTIDATEYAGTAADLNLEPDLGYPAFAILDFATVKKYPFPQTREITREAIAEFVADFLGGTLKPSITSQPVPEKQDGPVTVVVGRSFREMVVDNDRDVLVQIYAPWCGHSKRLAPKYEILGSEYAASNFTDKVTLAKIDGTVNDVPDGIPKGYPMLMLYPAGSKDAPVMYDGDRSLEDLVKFISEKGKYGASISISEKAAEAAAEESPAAREDESRGSKHDEL
jgi:protein disulfide-isomerase A1